MKKTILFITILLLVVLGLLFFIKKDKVISNENTNLTTEQQDKLKITFLDVGQGDATFIEFPDGQQMLVDCAIDGRILEALGRVMDYYDHDIDYLLITHPDSDHYGGCAEVLKRFDVKNIIYNGTKKEYDDFWVAFWQAVQAEQAKYVEVDHEDVWEIASTSLHWLYPDQPLALATSTWQKESNNGSIVFELNYNGKEALFMGDAEIDLEKYLLNTYGEQLETDILKVGHHGSSGASHQEFVDVVSPEYAIFSAGKNNQFGHPSPRVEKRLERASSTIWRTDLGGDIVCEIGDLINCNYKNIYVDQKTN
ncbi:MAG: MBL fold metallo-hydrolase [Candidatus Magasanikiibacteriota bacterium]